VKNCDRGEVQGPRSQFFTIRTDLKPVNNLLIFASSQMKKKLTEKNSRKRYCDCVTNQSDCRIRYRVRLERNINIYIYKISVNEARKPRGANKAFNNFFSHRSS